MALKKADLIRLCQFNGIPLTDGIKYRNKDLIYKLGQKSLELGKRQNSWGLQERIMVSQPMICAWFKNLKEPQKAILWEDDNKWIAEQKQNGLRLICFYHPDFGFQFFSRHTSDIDFLPIEYPNICLNMGNTLLHGAEYKGRIKFPFIIDTECITTNKTLDLSILPRNANKLTNFSAETRQNQFRIGSELNSACSIVQYNESDSFLLQQQNPLVFQAFDVIMVDNHYLYNVPLANRLKILKEIFRFLPPCFKECYVTNVNKRDYYEKLIEGGAEGIVLKALDSPYNNAGTRHADKWVKLKRDMATQSGKDIDAFITGYSIGTGKNENMVGSIEFSVMLMDKNGLERPHVIANIGGITDNFRRLITDYDETGKPKLKEEMYNKVFVINGHTVSAVNLRFNHAVLVSETPRFDKNYYQCDLPEEVLRANIL